jgi:hypothetical protein
LVFPVRRLAPHGLEAWAQVVERGYEGYVAKNEASRVRAWPDEALAQGQAEGLDRRGGPMAGRNQRRAAGYIGSTRTKSASRISWHLSSK